MSCTFVTATCGFVIQTWFLDYVLSIHIITYIFKLDSRNFLIGFIVTAHKSFLGSIIPQLIPDILNFLPQLAATSWRFEKVMVKAYEEDMEARRLPGHLGWHCSAADFAAAQPGGS